MRAASATDRHSSVPLRPLGLAELLDGAVRLFRHNAASVFVLALPFAVAATVAVTAVEVAAADANSIGIWRQLSALLAAELFGTMRTAVLTPVFTGDLTGSRVGAGAALRRVGGSVVPLVVLGVVVMVVQGAGAVALGVAGVWLWGVWAVAAPALVAERLGPWQALRRSFDLVRGAFWRTWSVRALGSVVVYVLGQLFSVPFAALATALTGTNPLEAGSQGISHPQLFFVVSAAGALVAAALTAPLSSAVDFLLYTDRRIRREGMDLRLALPREPRPSVEQHAGMTAW